MHAAGGKIAMQILHFGRYAYHEDLVAPSPLQAPISPFPPHELTDAEIEQTVEDFARAAELARRAGYDGVEIMGSEGYLINEFIVAATNRRTDRWGGSYENRIRFPVEIVRRVRERVGTDFILIYRLSMIDLVPGGSTLEEVVQLAKEIEAMRRHHHQHRHRLARGPHPDHRDVGAARRVHLRHQEGHGRGLHPARHHEPHQHP